MIVCEALEYQTGGFCLGPLDLEIVPGVTVLLGPNGAGKSTLLALLAGLERPKSGRVLIEGRNPLLVSAHERAALAAFAPQSPPAVYGMSAADFVATGAFRKTKRVYSDSAAQRALREALEAANITERAAQNFASLSGGEQRRALFARALLQDAEWMLLDEPTSFLDYAHNQILFTLLRKLKEEKRNLILVTHDADFAAHIADHVIFLRGGKVCRSGSRELASCPEVLQEVFAAPFRRAGAPNGRVHPSYGDQTF